MLLSHLVSQDLSLKGLLLQLTDTQVRFNTDMLVQIEFTLPVSDIVVSLTANIVNLLEQQMRGCITEIDIESVSHLKRIVQLNVGDDQLLHREIEHLANWGG
ncbi:PilZ domain-containing protein [Vibrio agarivorans]|uniref:PilZ domain-containing protein n=1 Tax=Vibrio agarivorans TaxID=153622 RepID=A0ABT7Y1Q0_9VIBR|nr:PilZ domain-containing protein [Vibrio agarivorans]MDN2481961.1 PilZ domain-containing protein [Vibrio agarivorans]